MLRASPALELEPEPMDILKMPAEPERAAEQEEQPEEEEKEEYEETIMLRASDLVAFQDILEDMRSQIVDLQRNSCQDRLET
jgi:hypothetical protein